LIDFSNKRDVPSSDIENTNDNYYKNDFFGFSIEKPDGWYSMSSEGLNSLFQSVSIPMLSNNNNDAGQILKTAKNALIPLFGFMEYPIGTQNGKFNPNIIALATNMTGETTIENDCDIFIQSNKLIQGPQMTILSNSDCREVDVNGKKFAMQELTLNMFNLSIIKQIQYVRSTSNGYSFTFTLAYNNDDNKKQLQDIMHTLKFTK
jgi:hypothetical protein